MTPHFAFDLNFLKSPTASKWGSFIVESHNFVKIEKQIEKAITIPLDAFDSLR